MHRTQLAVLIASLVAAGTVEAQQPRSVHPPARWLIGGHSVAAFGTSVGTGGPDDIRTSTGLGAGIQVGYLISPRFTAYAGFELAKQPIDVIGVDGNFGLTHLEAGAKLNFPLRRSKLMPYVGAWVGRRSMSTTVQTFGGESDRSVAGMAVGGSGGVQYFVSPTLALDGALNVGIGKMGNWKADGQRIEVGSLNNTTTIRLQFGANWYP